MNDEVYIPNMQWYSIMDAFVRQLKTIWYQKVQSSLEMMDLKMLYLVTLKSNLCRAGDFIVEHVSCTYSTGCTNSGKSTMWPAPSILNSKYRRR